MRRADHLVGAYGTSTSDERGIFEYIHYIEDIQIHLVFIHPNDPWADDIGSTAVLEIWTLNGGVPGNVNVAKAHRIDGEWIVSEDFNYYDGPRVLDMFRKIMVLDDLAKV